MMARIPITGQIAEVTRELALRNNVYAQRVRDHKMRQSEADLCMERMQAVLATLMFCQEHEADIRAYITAKRGEQPSVATASQDAADSSARRIEASCGGRELSLEKFR